MRTAYFTLIICWCLTLLLMQKGVIAQLTPFNTLSAPISPNAAALGKYVDVPVGHYNGVPNINVPLYKFDIKDISIPISLSYHASGVKVKEIPGPVGLGWTLNAGGLITRIVKGLPDTHDGLYYLDEWATKRRVVNAYQNGFTSEFNLEEQYNLCLSSPGVVAANAFKDLPSPLPGYPVHRYQRIDTETDLYYFNFLNYTGQFTFTNEGTPMLLSTSDIKIEYIQDVFKLTDGQFN